MITFQLLLDTLGVIGLLVVSIVILLINIYFIFSIISLIREDDAKKRGEKIGYALLIIFFIFVLVSLWGFINFFRHLFGFDFREETVVTDDSAITQSAIDRIVKPRATQVQKQYCLQHPTDGKCLTVRL